MPIIGLIVIASFPQLDLQSPDLYPIRAVGIPELLQRDSSG